MTSPRMIRALVLGSGLVLALGCKYSEPDAKLGNDEQKLSNESHSTPEGANQNSSSAEPKKGTPDESKRQPTEASGTCDDRSCVAGQDCCSGYQCGFDPERSKVERYCLPQ